jgi:RHS repeat-associated protein
LTFCRRSPTTTCSLGGEAGWWSAALGGSLILNKRDLTGNIYMRNRYYDPQSGRFSQEDPIGLAGGLNLYGFAAGDPLNYYDPFGLCPKHLYDKETKTCPVA